MQVVLLAVLHIRFDAAGAVAHSVDDAGAVRHPHGNAPRAHHGLQAAVQGHQGGPGAGAHARGAPRARGRGAGQGPCGAPATGATSPESLTALNVQLVTHRPSPCAPSSTPELARVRLHHHGGAAGRRLADHGAGRRDRGLIPDRPGARPRARARVVRGSVYVRPQCMPRCETPAQRLARAHFLQPARPLANARPPAAAPHHPPPTPCRW